MRFSILHISDLHRDLKDELANGPLLESLIRDIERYKDQVPPILPPSLCVVSGDLIYGVSPRHPDPQAELERQYGQALGFLISVADAFFNGNRERVVLIPGNHDVSYPAVMASATPIDIPANPSDRKALTDELWAQNTWLRWSWAEMRFYRIHDPALYEQRLAGFAKAYDRFYSGKRLFSMTPEKQFCVFDYPELAFSIAALNSCHRNDPLQRSGSFHPAALSAACSELRKVHRTGWLLAATWHHSVGGSPAQNDFLDHEYMQYLIDSGVSLGFHGHQHTHDCVDERYRLGPGQRKMTIVSASTLCAEQGNLKPGIPRGYNVVEVDTEKWNGRVHSRRMVNNSFNLPVWGPGQFNATGTSFVDFELGRPLAKRPPRLDIALLLERADDLLGKSQWSEALGVLKDIKEEPLARPFLITALTQLGDDSETVDVLWPPSSNQEIVMVGASILNLKDGSRAKAFLQLDKVSNNTDASVMDVKRRISMRWSK
jgi:3',5'-cyclic AMP phosphodiesterase CpdA